MRIDLPLDHYPYQLSGGQKQLVAIARAIIHKPELLLMDEPFDALDYETRLAMQDELLKIWGKAKVTTLFVSHEIDEAIYLADRVVVLTKRPAQVKKVFDITLPRPRTQEMLENEEFFLLKNDVLVAFREEMSL